jgi:tRNA (uracil-5-)-methyltransferase TRM9
MRKNVVQKLLTLNRQFYRQMAEPFARSRRFIQPGFLQMLDHLPDPCPALLDVGCGDGRLGRFLLEKERVSRYHGLDFSAPLLKLAVAQTSELAQGAAEFTQRDISQAGCLADLGQFDAVACLATLQHLPGRANRIRLLREMADQLSPNGRIILSNWQFYDNARQQRKLLDWSLVKLSEADVEPGDYLLSWRRGGHGRRYVAYIDQAETEKLAAEAGLVCLTHFRADGKEGDLNLYTVLAVSATDVKT